MQKYISKYFINAGTDFYKIAIYLRSTQFPDRIFMVGNFIKNIDAMYHDLYHYKCRNFYHYLSKGEFVPHSLKFGDEILTDERNKELMQKYPWLENHLEKVYDEDILNECIADIMCEYCFTRDKWEFILEDHCEIDELPFPIDQNGMILDYRCFFGEVLDSSLSDLDIRKKYFNWDNFYDTYDNMVANIYYFYLPNHYIQQKIYLAHDKELDLLKIGVSDNIKIRSSALRNIYNKTTDKIKIISYIKGDKNLNEKIIQSKFNKFRKFEKGSNQTEWFEFHNKILSFFEENGIKVD